MAKLTLGKKLAFASADIFGGGAFNIINFLYPGFLAFTVGLPPYWIGFVMLVARIWDAVSDPFMGIISDGAKSRMGKRRIFLVIFAPLIVVSFTLMFFPYAFNQLSLRIVASLFSYLFFCTVQTAVMIPYYSLSSEISSDYSERASANSYRLGFSIFSSILCVVFPSIVVQSFEAKQGYTVMGLIFGSFFAISVLVTGFFAREEICTPPVKAKLDFGLAVKLFKVKPFSLLIGMFIMLQTTMAIVSGMFFFLVDFYLYANNTARGESTTVGLFSAAFMFIMQIIALPFYLFLIKKTNKAFTYRLGAFIWIISALTLFFVPSNPPQQTVFLLAAFMGFGICAPGLTPHTMFGDVADAVELETGVRNEGLMSGIINFMNKLGQATGLAIAMSILGFFGFKEATIGQTILTQPQSAQTALRMITAFSPLVLMGLGIFLSFFYTIDKTKQQQIKNQLQNLL